MEHTHSNSAATEARTQRMRLLLVGGDIVSFIVFAIIGRSSHGEAAGLAAMVEVLKTAAPFLLGWFLVAPWLKAYRPPEGQTGAFLRSTALAWLVAWPLALLLRALFLQRGIPVSFALVTLISNLVLLLGWRGVFAWLTNRAR